MELHSLDFVLVVVKHILKTSPKYLLYIVMNHHYYLHCLTKIIRFIWRQNLSMDGWHETKWNEAILLEPVLCFYKASYLHSCALLSFSLLILGSPQHWFIDMVECFIIRHEENVHSWFLHCRKHQWRFLPQKSENTWCVLGQDRRFIKLPSLWRNVIHVYWIE